MTNTAPNLSAYNERDIIKLAGHVCDWMNAIIYEDTSLLPKGKGTTTPPPEDEPEEE